MNTDPYPCPGNGMCLYEEEPGQFTRKDYMTCEFKCQPAKCPNYKVCGTTSTEWMFSCSQGMCGYCLSVQMGPIDHNIVLKKNRK